MCGLGSIQFVFSIVRLKALDVTEEEDACILVKEGLCCLRLQHSHRP